MYCLMAMAIIILDTTGTHHLCLVQRRARFSFDSTISLCQRQPTFNNQPGVLSTLPQCNINQGTQEVEVSVMYLVTDLILPTIPECCILGYQLTCLIG